MVCDISAIDDGVVDTGVDGELSFFYKNKNIFLPGLIISYIS